jgi:hypothetical protein
MTVQFKVEWNGYDAGGVYTLSAPEEARLIAAGIAFNYVPVSQVAAGLTSAQLAAGAVAPAAVSSTGSILGADGSPVSGGQGVLPAKLAALKPRYQGTATAATITYGNQDALDTAQQWYPAISATAAADGDARTLRASGYFSGLKSSWAYIDNLYLSGGQEGRWAAYVLRAPVRFRHNGRTMILILNGGSAEKVIVYDGENNVTPGGAFALIGGARCYRVDFGTWASRRVRVELTGGARMAAVGCAETGASLLADGVPEVTAVAVGDSYGGYNTSSVNITRGIFRDALNRAGVTDVAVDQIGGTGYKAKYGNQNGLERLPTAIAWAPEVLLTVLGINDPGTSEGGTYAQAEANVTAYYTQARAGLPNAVILATGSWCPDENNAYTVGGNAQLMGGYILAALRSISGPWAYIDNINGTIIVKPSATVAEQTIFMTGGVSWQSGRGSRCDLTATFTSATTATMTAAWPIASGTYVLRMDDGLTIAVTATQGSPTLTWGSPSTTTSTVGSMTPAGALVGNGGKYVSNDRTHPTAPPVLPAGSDYLADALGAAVFAALQRISAYQ